MSDSVEWRSWFAQSKLLSAAWQTTRAAVVNNIIGRIGSVATRCFRRD